MARKPLVGTVAANVLEYGTGGLNIDACRVGTDDNLNGGTYGGVFGNGKPTLKKDIGTGRWPANLIHDGSEEVLALMPMTKPSKANEKSDGRAVAFYQAGGCKAGGLSGRHDPSNSHSDAGGSAARFFYCAKASKRERNQGLDSTRTVKYDIDRQLIGDLPCLKVATVLVQLLRKATFGSGVKWNIEESGESITGLFQLDSLSTIKMKTSEITESKILSLLTPSLISEFIADVNCGMVSGGSHAESVESSSLLMQTSTGESLAELAHGVRLVVSPMLSQIKDEENWVTMTNFHATVKPIALMEYLVKLASAPGAVVLDPFMGSGTTGIACRNLGREFIGIEMDEAYFEIAQRRIGVQTAEDLF